MNMGKVRDQRYQFRRMAADLREKIMTGTVPLGSQLPSTQGLMTEYSAASTTVRRALAMLKREGLVMGVVGRGVYARDRQPFVVPASPYFVPSEGGWSYDLLRVGEEAPPPDIATALRLPCGSPAILRKRLTRFDGEPVDLSAMFYPLEIARDSVLAGQSKIKGGAPRALVELGYPERRFVDHVSARAPTTEEMVLLELPDDVPVMRQFRVVYSDGDRPVWAAVLIKGAHRFVLEYQRTLAPLSA